MVLPSENLCMLYEAFMQFQKSPMLILTQLFIVNTKWPSILAHLCLSSCPATLTAVKNDIYQTDNLSVKIFPK